MSASGLLPECTSTFSYKGLIHSTANDRKKKEGRKEGRTEKEGKKKRREKKGNDCTFDGKSILVVGFFTWWWDTCLCRCACGCVCTVMWNPEANPECHSSGALQTTLVFETWSLIGL